MWRRVIEGTLLVLAIVAVAGAWYLWRVGAGEGPPLAGEMTVLEVHASPLALPDLTLVDGEGRSVTLDEFAGRVVLINLWATWCGPCVEEMPALDRLEAALGGPDFQVVTISVDQGGFDDVAPFFATHGLSHLRPYVDPTGRAPSAFAVAGLPTSLVIDRQGRRVGTYTGPADWDSPDALALLRWFIDPPTAIRSGS